MTVPISSVWRVNILISFRFPTKIFLVFLQDDSFSAFWLLIFIFIVPVGHNIAEGKPVGCALDAHIGNNSLWNLNTICIYFVSATTIRWEWRWIKIYSKKKSIKCLLLSIVVRRVKTQFSLAHWVRFFRMIFFSQALALARKKMKRNEKIYL